MFYAVNVRKNDCNYYAGRLSNGFIGSSLANPFIMRRESDRDFAINKYREWLSKQIQNLNPLVLNEIKKIYEINKKQDVHIGCWCKPKPCHVDVLIEFLNREDVKRIVYEQN